MTFTNLSLMSSRFTEWCLFAYLLFIATWAIFQLSCGLLYYDGKKVILIHTNSICNQIDVIQTVLLGLRFLGFPWRPSVSLLFFEHQGNDLLRAKGVVILDTGHLLTSHPTDIQSKVYSACKISSFKLKLLIKTCFVQKSQNFNYANICQKVFHRFCFKIIISYQCSVSTFS